MPKREIMLPKEVLDLLGDTPEQIEQRVHEVMVLALYRQHEISAGRAAELMNLDLLSFVRLAGEHGIPYFDMPPEQWEHEVRSIEKE